MNQDSKFLDFGVPSRNQETEIASNQLCQGRNSKGVFRLLATLTLNSTKQERQEMSRTSYPSYSWNEHSRNRCVARSNRVKHATLRRGRLPWSVAVAVVNRAKATITPSGTGGLPCNDPSTRVKRRCRDSLAISTSFVAFLIQFILSQNIKDCKGSPIHRHPLSKHCWFPC